MKTEACISREKMSRPKCPHCDKPLYYEPVLDEYECINQECLNKGDKYVKERIQKKIIMFGGRCVVKPDKIIYKPPIPLPKACRKEDDCEACKINRKVLNEEEVAKQVWHDLQRDVRVIKKVM